MISIVESLQGIVNQYPEKTAVVADADSYSYHSLWQEVSACATYLKQNGLKPGDRVAVLLNNSIEYITSYYGIVACGGVVVALNTNAKPTDIANWVQHASADILITELGLYRRIASDATTLEQRQLIIIDSGEDSAEGRFWTRQIKASAPDLFQPSPVSGGMPATIIYTSGTTGNPKGVTLSHDNLMANFTAVIDYLHLVSDDSILNILPFYYSYGNSILHTHLLTGATIILENDFMYPVKTLNRIARMKVTGFSGVPATYSILLNKTSLREYDLSSLRYVTQAGGAMPTANIRKFAEHLGHTKFYIMYGQTEATARLTYLEPADLFDKMGSVGKPLKCVNIEIRDKSGGIVDAGVIGELFVSGPNIMQGYWRNKCLTDQVIINGFLKTGDLGYKDKDGYIFLTGRRSDMIKVGGNRISPLEIEEIVHQIDGIDEVAATGVEDELLGQVIKLTVVKNKNSALTERQIKAYCRQNLALYKTPKFINFVDSMPKTASGKVKRFLL